MTSREAKKIAYAILALDDLQSIVVAQLDKFNFSAEDKKRIATAAESLSLELYRRAGQTAVERVLREDGPDGAEWDPGPPHAQASRPMGGK